MENQEYSKTYYDQYYVFSEIKKYFSIKELVSPEVLAKYGEAQSWSFLDFRLLSNLLYIRENRGNSITINNGGAQQRGLRENTSPIVKGRTDKDKIYLSGHVLGMAIDFHESDGDSAEDIRKWIVDHHATIPFKCRLEHMKDGVPISWVHMDVAYFENHGRVYLFDV